MDFVKFFEDKAAIAEYYLHLAEEQGNVNQIAEMSGKYDAYKAAASALMKARSAECP